MPCFVTKLDQYPAAATECEQNDGARLHPGTSGRRVQPERSHASTGQPPIANDYSTPDRQERHRADMRIYRRVPEGSWFG